MKKIIHPLEDVFGIEHGSMSFGIDNELTSFDPPGEMTPVQEQDEEDLIINQDIQKVYDSAMEAYENQISYVEIAEPKFAARNAEVANQYLNTALSALALKARVKNDKRKNTQFIPYNNTTNNVLVADRNQILEMMDKSS
jgi:hypothetical protein